MKAGATVEELEWIHADQIARFGGASGTRSQAGLEAAQARPASGYHTDVIEAAAALWEGLSQNHPFVDGNKRTSFAAMHIYLLVNGHTLEADAAQAGDFIERTLREGRFRKTTLEQWLRAHARATA